MSVLLYHPLGGVHIRNLERLSSVLPNFQFRILLNKHSGFAKEISSSLSHEYLYVDERSPGHVFISGDVTALVLANAQANLVILNLIEAARERDIPVIAVEEVAQVALNDGILNSYLLPVDHLLLASPFEYSAFSALGIPQCRLRVVGWPFHHSACIGDRDSVRSNLRSQWDIPDQKKIATLFLSPLNRTETIGSLEMLSMRQRLLAMVKNGMPEDHELVIKLHPMENIRDAREDIHSILPGVTIVGSDIGAAEILAATDICINRGNSQVVLESLLDGIPVAILPCGLRTIFDDLLPEVCVSDSEELRRLFETYRSKSFPDWDRILSVHCPHLPKDALKFTGQIISDIASSKNLNSSDEDMLDIALYRSILGDPEGGRRSLGRLHLANKVSFASVEKLLHGESSVDNLIKYLDADESVRYRWPLAVSQWILNQSRGGKINEEKLKDLFWRLEVLGGFPPVFNPHIFMRYAIKFLKILNSCDLNDEFIVLNRKIKSRAIINDMQLNIFKNEMYIGKKQFIKSKIKNFYHQFFSS